MREEEMNCKEMRELLTAYRDGEVTPEEKAYIESHLPGCPDCQAELEALSATQTSLRGALKSMADEVSASTQAWEKVRARLEKKGSWIDGLRRLLISKTWQVATVTAAVIVIAVVAAIWQFSGVGQAPPIPAPAPAPRPAPPPPFEARVVPEEALYLPGQVVEVKLLVRNTSVDVITMKPYPPEIKVTPLSNPDQTLFSVAPGTQSVEIKPSDAITVDFSWDQKDKDGKQVPPGWYNIIFTNTAFSQGDRTIGINLPARVLIQYPRGVMEKSLDVNQSQTVNGITVTLERIELTADGSTFYFFFIPPGYTPPSTGPGLPPMPPPIDVVAKAEYSFNSITRNAGFAGFRTEGDGIGLVWGGGPHRLDPVPSDAKELTIRITKLGDWEGPWEFKISLD